MGAPVATVADLVVSRLAAAGVGRLFGVPGGAGNLDLVAAAGRADLPFVLTATETGAAIAAQVYGELTGSLGVCLTTLGPGAASAANGVACAALERAPLLVFTDRQGPSPDGPRLHQQIKQRALFRSLAKRSADLRGRSAARAVEAAIRDALAGPPGPVHLDCPGDVLSWPAGTHVPVGAARARPHRRHAVPARIRTLLRRARHPVALVGLGARRAEDARAIDDLCRRCGVPALVTYKAKGVVPDHHPWFGGVFTNGAIEQPLVGQADLILAIGLDPVELLPRPWPYRAPVVSAHAWPIPPSQMPVAGRLAGNVAEAVAIMAHGLGQSRWDRSTVEEHLEAQATAIDLPTSGLSAQDVVKVAATACARTHRLTVDAGAHMFPATMLWPARSTDGVLISNGLSTMGYAVPAAVGAALAEPSTPVVAFTGDGGLLMCAGELTTLARERLGVTVVVFNDASLSLIEIKQQARQLPAAGVELTPVDWAALAMSVGLAGFRATTREELATALRQASEAGGPALVDVRIDRANYGATLRAIRGS